MNEYRIDVFNEAYHKRYYFDDEVSAILFGQEKLKCFATYAVFLSRLVCDNKYDILCAIKG